MRRTTAFGKIIQLLAMLFLASGLVACSKSTAFLADGGDNPAISGNAGDDASASGNAVSPHPPQVIVAPCWQPLALRLAKDGLQGPEVDGLLQSLGDRPTQSPMGRKIRELYKSQILRQKTKVKKQRHYKGVVTADNAQVCRDFIATHQASFCNAEKNFGVPPSVAVALLFVETRLGKVLGDVPENAFYTLASMSVSRTPEAIDSWLDKLPGYEQHMGWLENTMNKRADWAYVETRALVRHILRDHISPDHLPGSIYGAVGLCQFMPSNISMYGVDGDSDGTVDLFTLPDAVASLSNYLTRHGWRQGLSYEQQHKVLMTYNHSSTYAYTILDLALLIDNKKQTNSPRRKTGKRHG